MSSDCLSEFSFAGTHPTRTKGLEMFQQPSSLVTSRRVFLQQLGIGVGATTIACSDWQAAFSNPPGMAKPRSMILLWMSGGPSQLDTFDLKTGHENGGSTKPIQTAVPGIGIAESLPGVAKHMQELAIIRSVTTAEGDHERATQLMLTGQRPTQGGVNYPSLGALMAHELSDEENELPQNVSVSSFRFGNTGGPGFLGPNFAPLIVSGNSADPEVRANLSIENLRPPQGVSASEMQQRFDLAEFFQKDFQSRVDTSAVRTHRANFKKARRLVSNNAQGAFQLDTEPAELRNKYGRSQFGQGCLLARRLVERGCAFVEVTLDGWDTHADNFAAVKRLNETLDPAWSTLLDDLRERGLLDQTLVVWMGEFGRTPKINPTGGRDHFPVAWSMVLGGGHIRGGQTYGKTNAGGTEVVDQPVKIADVYATFCAGVGLSPEKENISPEGRPIPLADRAGKVIQELIRKA